MGRLAAVSLIVASMGTLIVLARNVHSAKSDRNPLGALAQTYLAVDAKDPVRVPLLIDSDGNAFGPHQLQGHWTPVFFGFTACPIVCPKTLSLLSAMALNPKSGVTTGSTKLIFVSVDPERDTPERIRKYLDHFDPHIVGLTGSRGAIDRFASEIGAGSQYTGPGIDHSTSLFVLNARGSLAGILMRPNHPARIVADLAILRRGDADAHSSQKR